MTSHEDNESVITEEITSQGGVELNEVVAGQIIDNTDSFMRRALLRVHDSRLVRALPVLSRWAEVSSACSCSSVCPACIGVTAGSLLVPALVESHEHKPDDDKV